MKYFFTLAICISAFSFSVRANIYTVTSHNFNGTGSLKWAITQVNTNPGMDTIYFNLSGPVPANVKADSLFSYLPHINGNALVDGSSQPLNGYIGMLPPVRIKGRFIVEGSNFSLYRVYMDDGVSSGEFRVLNGSNIEIGKPGFGNFFNTNDYSQIELYNCSYFSIRNNYMGTDTANDYDDIHLSWCNHGYIQGNVIGLDTSLQFSTDLNYTGININNADSFIVIGGNDPSEYNIIGNHGYCNIWLNADSIISNVSVLGNKMGMVADTLPINTFCTLRIDGNVQHCVIGSDNPDGANLIPNTIRFFDSIPKFNTIKFNIFNSSANYNIGPPECVNECKPVPIITYDTILNLFSGTSEPFDTIRIFGGDSLYPGIQNVTCYLVKTITDASGNWSYGGNYITDTIPYDMVTANATDLDGNTSNLTTPIPVLFNSVETIAGVSTVTLVYPNPCTDCFVKTNDSKFIEAYDLFGRKIYTQFEKGSNGSRIVFSNNEHGIFILHNLKTGEAEKFIRTAD